MLNNLKSRLAGKNLRLTSIVVLSILLTGISLAQGTSINTTAAVADVSAILDISSTTQGVLVPRMTAAEKKAISSPAQGLMLYQTDSTKGFKYHDGTNWQSISTESGAGALSTVTNSQAGKGISLNTTGAAADASAILDVSSTTQGVLFPRMTETERTSIATPKEGLLVFQTDGEKGFYYAADSEWYQIKTVPLVNLKIGDRYAGGIIIYLDNTLEHGIVAATSDQGGKVSWSTGDSGTYVVTGATKKGIGGGKENTEKIVAKQGTGTYAAKICVDYRGGGFDDWYLPSENEVDLIYENLYRKNIGSVAADYYWSSTEFDLSIAMTQICNQTGMSYGHLKKTEHRVRPVRAF